jgi:hypothetical protein
MFKLSFDQDDIFNIEGKKRIPPCPGCALDLPLADLQTLFPERYITQY